MEVINMARNKSIGKPTFEQWSQLPDVKAKYKVVPAVIVAEMIKTRGIDLNKARVESMREEYGRKYEQSSEG